MSFEILQGDCIERMVEMEEASIDAVVCDPPYGIDFMGKEWDSFSPARIAKHAESVKRKGTEKASEQYADRFGKSQGAGVAIKYDESPDANRRFQLWCESWARECLRVLKPGGHLLACGGARTHHRLVCGIEDAGFEIRDRIDTPDGRAVHTPDGTVAWYFGSGFPKGKDVHKALVAMGEKQSCAWLSCPYGSPAAEAHRDQIEAAVAELEQPVEDEEWDGWNVALKPAHEPIVVARKPLIGTVAENVLEYGTGGINVGGCRIEGPGWVRPNGDAGAGFKTEKFLGDAGRGEPTQTEGVRESAVGRWPANVVLSEEAAAELDAQSGVLQSGFMAAGTEREGIGYQGGLGNRVRNDTHGDSGGASRFFYCAKTSRAERNAGLEGFDAKALTWSSGEQSPGTFQADGTDRSASNHHPTVKPINLMRWLVRLVTPPGGVVLDPFLGSGSTGCAAVLEGFDFVGIEREAEYIAIAEARIAFWSQHEGREVEDVLKLHGRSEKATKAHADAGQLAMAGEISGGGFQMTVDDVLADIAATPQIPGERVA